MRQIVNLPKFGLQMTEGYISEWKVAEGDAVHEGDVLFTVETDKLVNEVEAPCSGTVSSILVEEGDEVEVGAPCCYIDC